MRQSREYMETLGTTIRNPIIPGFELARRRANCRWRCDVRNGTIYLVEKSNEQIPTRPNCYH